MDGQSQVSGGSGPAPVEWLANALRQRFDEVMRQREKAIEPSNVEGVHDMRVAIRRFRSLLSDIPALQKVRGMRRLRKQLRKEAKLLGDVRDQDVYAASLRSMAGGGGDKFRAGVQILIDESVRNRDDAFQDLDARLAKHHVKTIAEQFASAMEAVAHEPHLISAGNVTTVGREVVSARLRDLSKLGGSIYDPFDKKGLHKLRIAAKRLRYSAELFEPVLGPPAQAIAAEAARMQSLLGDVHDRDVWTATLSKLLKPKRRSAALHRVFSTIIKKRSKRYRSALKLWSLWQRSRFFDESMASLTPRPR